MKTKQECYEEATLKSVGDNPQGTRMDVIYLAMEIYADQFKDASKINNPIKVQDDSLLSKLIGSLQPEKIRNLVATICKISVEINTWQFMSIEELFSKCEFIINDLDKELFEVAMEICYDRQILTCVNTEHGFCGQSNTMEGPMIPFEKLKATVEDIIERGKYPYRILTREDFLQMNPQLQ